MTEKDQLIRAKFGILALAAEMKNVGRACKIARISRSQFYAMKKAYETLVKKDCCQGLVRGLKCQTVSQH